MDDEKDGPKSLPPHLRGLSPGAVDGADAEDRRALADLHTNLERRQRERRAEGFVPEPVAELLAGEPEPLASDAGRLWMELPAWGVAGALEFRRAAKRAGLDDARAEEALDALRRAELAWRGPESVTRHTPGSVPF